MWNNQDAEKGTGWLERSPCSQNAHGETVLVRCAQLEAALVTPLEGEIGKEKTLARNKARLAAPELGG